MKTTDIPTKFPIPFGNAAAPGTIRAVPEASQITIQAGAASLTDGFPPVTQLPVGAGGTPPFGQDMNGILLQTTGWSRWQNAGAPVFYDASFSSSIGGYPTGAILASAVTLGYFWFSLVDDNADDPEAGGANWQGFTPLGGDTTGDFKWRPTSETLAGYVKANDGTIGDASSGASLLAAAAAKNLFAWLWNNFSDAQCPVSSGRGATAALDFAAHKTIAVIDMRGTGPMGMDTMGGGATTRLASVPVTSGSATAAGSVLGENLHALVSDENGPHTHDVTAIANRQTGNQSGNDGQFPQAQSTFPTASSGLGTAHNTVQRSMVGTWYIKL